MRLLYIITQMILSSNKTFFQNKNHFVDKGNTEINGSNN